MKNTWLNAVLFAIGIAAITAICTAGAMYFFIYFTHNGYIALFATLSVSIISLIVIAIFLDRREGSPDAQ